MTKNNKDLIKWLRVHSSRNYRPPAEGALRLEVALAVIRDVMRQLPAKREWLSPESERDANWLLSLDGADAVQAPSGSPATELASAKKVTAHIFSDDRRCDLESVDVTSWFMQASDDELFELSMTITAFGGVYVSDGIARYISYSNTEVERMFDYIHKVKVGFECYVDEGEACAWVREFRPTVWAEYLKAGVVEP